MDTEKIIEKIVYVYLARSESMIKAQRKYRENNPAKHNELSMKYYNKNKDNPEFKLKTSLKKKEYYLRKKENKLKESQNIISV